MFNMHGLLYLSTLQCLWLFFPHGKEKKHDFQLCRPRFHFHALILHVHVEDTLIHCYPSCWDSKHLLNTRHPRGNLTADPACVTAVSYPLSYTGRNLKQRGFTFCRCAHQLGYKANKLRSKMSFLYGHCIVTIVFPTYYPNTCIQVIAAMRF